MKPKIQLEADAPVSVALRFVVESPGSVWVSINVVAAGVGLVTSTGNAVGWGVEKFEVLLLTGGGT